MGQIKSAASLPENQEQLIATVNCLQHEVLNQTRQLFTAATCSYDDFLGQINELNDLSSKVTSHSGKRLMFAVKRGTDQTVLWKATVRIALICLDVSSFKIISQRLVTLPQFLKIFSTIQNQLLSAMPSSSQEKSARTSLEESGSGSKSVGNLGSVRKSLTFSMLLNEVDEMAATNDELTECCICLENKPDVILPCAHSYCLPCIENWNNVSRSCPICRETLATTDDAWVISDVPGSEDVHQEICSSLLNLTSQP